MRSTVRRLFEGFSVFCLVSTGYGSDLSSADRQFFENRIRPVLVQSCYECHSTKAEKIGGKLQLDSKAAILTGGESGTALVPGEPDDSLLVHAMRWQHDLEMPPEEPVGPAVIADFEEWIRRGAPDPRSGETQQVSGKNYEEEALWSFRPPEKRTTPQDNTAGWIDHWIMDPWKTVELSPAPSATPRELVHRLYFDLTGLPPDFIEVNQFLAEHEKDSTKAIESLVDRLLASSHFGERWGRHWLDVARFAESNGNDGLSRNAAFPHAWRYRDYVIAAFNDDLPFDQFVIEQIAGDLLPAETPEARDRHRVATGFLAIGAKPAKAMNNNFDMDVIADQVQMIGSGLLGISIACARCHDHKFDPISARDYYALAGILQSSDTLWGLAGNEKLTAPPTDLHVLEAAAHVLPPEDFVETVILRESNTGNPKKLPKPKWEPGTPLAMGVREGKKIADAKLNIKGDAKKLGDLVPRGVPAVYNEQKTEAALKIPEGKSGRLELAQWITDPKHPHTARVYVNRVWGHLFGRGLVDTPNDFGVYGSRPTHPELLDSLAIHFVEDGWSIKKLIRTIVLTEAYQRSSATKEEFQERDPDNLWLARQARRRLDAEALRDRMLVSSGALDRTAPEGSLIRHRDILINLAGNIHEPSNHRSVYLCYLRSSPPPELAAFDLPSFLEPVAKRETSTRPGQALYLFNHPFVLEQSKKLAADVLAQNEDPKKRIEHIFRSVYSRDPDPEESYRAKEMLDRLPPQLEPADAWMALAQALYSSNEFRYLD